MYQPNKSLGREQGTVYNLQQFCLVNIYTKVKKKNYKSAEHLICCDMDKDGNNRRNTKYISPNWKYSSEKGKKVVHLIEL